MRSLPIDTRSIEFRLASIDQATRRQNPEDRNSPLVPKVDENGQLLWKVQCMVKQDDASGADAETVRAELLDVEVPGNERPRLGVFDEVEFDGLAARPWSMNGSSGVSFRARSVAKAGKSRPAAPAVPNGAQP